MSIRSMSVGLIIGPLTRLLLSLLTSLLLSLLMTGCISNGPETESASVEETPADLTIYTHDSLVGKDGFGTEAVRRFQIRCQCRVKLVSLGAASQIITRLELDRQRNQKHDAQVVLGIDQNLWKRSSEMFDQWGKKYPKAYNRLRGMVRVARGFMPFDYSVYTFMADLKRLKELGIKPPTRIDDLLRDQYRKQFILQDPRTSTPGLAFLLHTREKFYNKFANYWSLLRHQYLTLAPGWEEGYQLFLRGEAPLIWSYATSQAYHELKSKDGDRYQALKMVGGYPSQIEGAAILKGVSEEQYDLAYHFLLFLLEKEVQAEIPRRNWMFPVVEDVEMPEVFLRLRKKFFPRKLKKNSPKEISRDIRVWERAIEGLIDILPDDQEKR
jgi:thiamine transport system substrate-binding protein